jgi:hypothetical protein
VTNSVVSLKIFEFREIGSKFQKFFEKVLDFSKFIEICYKI